MDDDGFDDGSSDDVLDGNADAADVLEDTGATSTYEDNESPADESDNGDVSSTPTSTKVGASPVVSALEGLFRPSPPNGLVTPAGTTPVAAAQPAATTSSNTTPLIVAGAVGAALLFLL